MTHEFAPHAPVAEAAESRMTNKVERVTLKGAFEKMNDAAEARYQQALRIAERIDDEKEAREITEDIPFNKNAILAAMLTAFACTRSAQIS